MILSTHLIYYIGQPYRSRCLGSQTLELILASAATQTKPKIAKIYLHVQTSNDQAKKFYERHGFIEVELHKNYYKKIVPHDAWVLEKTIVPSKVETTAALQVRSPFLMVFSSLKVIY